MSSRKNKLEQKKEIPVVNFTYIMSSFVPVLHRAYEIIRIDSLILSNAVNERLNSCVPLNNNMSDLVQNKGN